MTIGMTSGLQILMVQTMMQTLIQAFKRNFLFIIIQLIIVFLLFQYHQTVENNLETKLKEQTSLTRAMRAEMTQLKNQDNELVSSKISLNADLEEVKKNYEYLSTNQKKIVDRMSKDKKSFAGTIADMEVRMGSLTVDGSAVNDSTVSFSVESDTISFKAKVNGVAPLNNNPKLEIKDLKIPNDMSVVFNWGEKKDGYPSTVSIVNSNPLFKVNNIDSYVIPEIRKEEIKPTFFQRMGRTFNTSKTPFIIGVGVGAAGVVATGLLVK
jgi:hypothetical protein